MAASGPTSTAFNDLPYLDEYLREILQPRAERTLQTIATAMNESVWQHLVRLLVAEQSGATDASPGMIRSLLEDRLGLRLEVSLNTSFANSPTAKAVEQPMPDVVIPKQGPGLPLVNAVISGETRGTRR